MVIAAIRRSALTAGAGVCLMGAVVLAAWALDIEPAKSIVPGYATMKANTAICFLLCSISLLLTGAQKPELSFAKGMAAIGSAAVALSLSLATTVEYLLGSNSGLDEWLFAASPILDESPYPGRMSVATASSFVLLSIALVLLGSRHKKLHVASQYVASSVVWIGFVALVGYSYGAPAPFGGEQLPLVSLAFNSMAIHTSLGFVALGIGAIVIKPDRGLMATVASPLLGGLMARRVLPMAVLVTAGAFVLGMSDRGEAYSSGFLLTLVVVGLLYLITCVIWLNAQSLNQLDEEHCDAREQLRAALLEKTVLLDEMHHRVMSSIEVISNLLDMQLLHAQTPEAREVLDECRSRLRSMSLVHEQLYRSSDGMHLDFESYLKILVDRLIQSRGRSAGDVRSRVEVANVQLPVEKAIPCALIVNELLSNSLKHAFSKDGSGEIRISLEQTSDGMARLSVSDTGVGFPRHVDPDNTPTVGLKLVRTLARQIGGEAQFLSNGGATVHVAFSPV